jgi:hypothetical protein
MTFPKFDLNPTALACLLTSSVMFSALPSTCEAGNPITVNTNSGAAFVPGNNDGLCSLAEALNNANEAGSTANHHVLTRLPGPRRDAPADDTDRHFHSERHRCDQPRWTARDRFPSTTDRPITF